MNHDQNRSAANFCLYCGTPLEWGVFGGSKRRHCPECQWTHYPRMKVGAGALLEKDGKLLLLKCTHAPFEDYWNIPAGYAEIDEHPDRTVVREVLEEAELHVEVDQLTAIYHFDDDPRGNGILVVYTCHKVGGQLAATDEGIEPTYFGADEIPEKLARGGHDQAIRAWQRSKGV